MQLVVDEQRGVHVLRVREPRLTYLLLTPLLDEVRRLVEAGTRRLALDLGAVAYVDSAAIGCLMDIHRLLQEHDGVVRLFGLQPRVRTMISMTGVLRIVEAHTDEAETLAAFEAPPGKEG